MLESELDAIMRRLRIEEEDDRLDRAISATPFDGELTTEQMRGRYAASFI